MQYLKKMKVTTLLVVSISILCIFVLNMYCIVNQSVSFVDETPFVFVIRGHIRKSFETKQLRTFLDQVIERFPNVRFYFQTWNKMECSKESSWKSNTYSDIEYTNVTRNHFLHYFNNEKMLTNILILDEENVEYNGRTTGYVGDSIAPIKGWKNMWYGKHEITNHVNKREENKDIKVVSFRYDYFDIPQNHSIQPSKIFRFIQNHIHSTNIGVNFMPNRRYGVDNLYIGDLGSMKRLVDVFHFQLDTLLDKLQPNVKHQEDLVPWVAERLYSDILD